MKTLTDYFDRVYVINCAHRPDRRQRVLAHLWNAGMVSDPLKLVVFNAIIGDWTTSPACWTSGQGAWGCLQSHRRLIEDVMHERDDRYQLTLGNVLVLEDDVVFLDNALADLNKFMDAVPEDWDQIYLGGQHRQQHEETSNPAVIVGRSVNRTHAYALAAKAFQPFYRHISHAPDYHGSNKHIDHQLELAHQRRDWKVYCPRVWICGQEEGASNISGKTNPRQTWI
ncbi:Glycosyl transferase, family 25 [uncultured Caudovirales phage]|uniref:Glycosyl transferase, family 25 n=1 Tax=uncultured Caudovirales phage TaxID=2100421 RepID=A0A6J5NUY6_9CAUD|nr:Glycosyl transferase, family 25 [uncultured Caudovirales phage]